MTASATTSSVVLLTSLAAAKSAAPPTAAVAAKASSDAGADGFQLLLAQAAEDVRAGVGSVKLPDATAVAKSPGDAQAGPDDGNELPLLAGLLPLGPTAPALALKTGGELKSSGDDKDGKQRKGKAEDPGQLLGISAATPAITPSLPSVAGAVAAGAGGSDADAKAAAVQADIASIGAASSGAVAALTQKSEAASRAAAGKTATSDADIASSTAAVVTDGSTKALDAGAISAALQGGAPHKTSDAADFDAVLKQLDTSGSMVSASGNGVDAGRSLQQASPPAADTNANAAAATVSVPVGAQGWSDAVTDKVMWFSANKFSSAEIHLNPPDLGPLQVRISTAHDQASVVFTSPHAAVRDALDQALPRLRDMLGSQGLQLLNVGVGGQGAAQQQYARGNASDNGRSNRGGYFGDVTDTAEPVAVTTVASARLSRSGIDAYA